MNDVLRQTLRALGLQMYAQDVFLRGKLSIHGWHAFVGECARSLSMTPTGDPLCGGYPIAEGSEIESVVLFQPTREGFLAIDARPDDGAYLHIASRRKFDSPAITGPVRMFGLGVDLLSAQEEVRKDSIFDAWLASGMHSPSGARPPSESDEEAAVMRESIFEGVIEIRVIPHNSQRYDTVGDWWLDDGGWHIRVSETGNWRYNFLVVFHELLEVAWCCWKGVRQSDVDAFDREYERNRKPGDNSQPGDDPKAPYRVGHQFAEAAERLAAAVLCVNWGEYTKTLDSLEYTQDA
jgi:hypothetical protein